jgi:hypothetical protein
MSSTNTNKQPVFIDRPLISRARVTNQVVGNSTSLMVQGGQAPAILVDMDATLSSDNNSGGLVDSIRIVRDDIPFANTIDYTVNADSAGDSIGFVSGQVIYLESTGVLTGAGGAEFGAGYYTYTGSIAYGGINTELAYSGVGPANTGFTYTSFESGQTPSVTFAVYHTRGTTVPIPGDGDYTVLFTKTIPPNVAAVDCSDVMPEINVPVPQQGTTAGLTTSGVPLKNRAINLQRGDRLYVGVVQKGNQSTSSGYIPGAHIFAQGGFY